MFLVRHGEYLPGTFGAGEPALSTRGWEQARAVGRFLARLGVHLERLVMSPYVRAQETAQAIVGELGEKPVMSIWQNLVPAGEPRAVMLALESLEGETSEVLVVGHMPLLGRVAHELCDAVSCGFALCTLMQFEYERGQWAFEGLWNCGEEM